MKSIVRMEFGSTLYGTRTPTSDLDYKTVFIPPTRDIILQRVTDSINRKTKENERDKNAPDDIDEEFLSVQKYLKLLMDGQTVSLDMLFAPNQFIIEKTFVWDLIKKNKDKFLSKQSAAFIGYCRQQANKYGIKGSRVAAVRGVLEVLKELDQHAKLGEFEAKWILLCEITEFVEILEIPQQSGQVLKHLQVCGRKLPYTVRIKDCVDILQRLFDEYGQRTLLAESNEGVDWKALSHAVRVGNQAITLFTEGEIVFPLPYAEHLLKIKSGQLTFQEVSEEIENLLPVVEKAAAVSTLPELPNRAWADEFLYGIYKMNVYGDLLNEIYPR